MNQEKNSKNLRPNDWIFTIKNCNYKDIMD